MDTDIYVLANDKQSTTALAFLNTYLPHRKYVDTTYKVWNEGQDFLFETEVALLEFLATTDNFVFTLAFYPNKTNSIYRNIQLYYNKDNSLICSLNIYQDSLLEDNLLKDLKLFLNSPHGYIAYHIPPERTKLDFIHINS